MRSVEMESYNKVVELAKSFLSEAEAYESKPTKASSKRLRTTMGDMKKLVTGARAELREADKQ